MGDESVAEIQRLQEALQQTQDRLFALESAFRVLAVCAHDAGAVPLATLVIDLTRAIRELHGKYGEEFPETVRWLIHYRDVLYELARPAPGP